MLAIAIPAVLLVVATQSHIEGDVHMIPYHNGGGYHELPVNQAHSGDPCDVQGDVHVAVRGKAGNVLYYTCK